MLIDWDMCKVRDDNEGHLQSGDRRPNRTVRVIPGMFVVIDTKLG
jgi:hypothetical protein